MTEMQTNLDYLRAQLGQDLLESHSFRGDDTILLAREKFYARILDLKDDARLKLNFLTDITAVDYLGKRIPRFELVYHLFSLTTKSRLRIKVPVPEEDPVIDSLTPIWKTANWLEREVWDMYGIRFSGHPDLRRILLYEEFEGHPLRKDYPVNQWQPLVPMRDVAGTFVDQRSRTKLLRMQQRFSKSHRR